MLQKIILYQWASFFVWATWFSMLLFGIFCILFFAPNMPLAEDWLMVPALTGNEKNIISWLWRQQNEHRIPIPKLILLGLLKLSHGDFRVGMIFNVFLVGLLTAIIIRVCFYIRGNKAYLTDTFIPLAVLHIGHGNNYFWSWQVGFVFPTALIFILFLIIVQYESAIKPSIALIASICLVLLPLCGANGLFFIIPFAPWLLYEGFLQWQNEKPSTNKWVGYVLISSVLFTGIEAAFYFVGYERPYWNPPSPNLMTTIKTSAKFQALSFGPGAEYIWYITIISVALILSATLYLLLSILRKNYTIHSYRAWGLLSFFCSGILFAFAMGNARAGLVPTYGLPHRYALLALPTLLASYFIWELYALNLWKKVMQWSLLLIMIGLLYPNTRKGYRWLAYFNEGSEKVINDIKTGMTCLSIAERNKEFLLHWDKRGLSSYLEMLKQAKIGVFRNIKADFKEVQGVPTVGN